MADEETPLPASNPGPIPIYPADVTWRMEEFTDEKVQFYLNRIYQAEAARRGTPVFQPPPFTPIPTPAKK